MALPGDATQWLEWLEKHHAFAFDGRGGHLSLLKEWRPRDSHGYWYAYVPPPLPLPSPPLQFEPLLLSKLALPRLPSELLLREHLLELLDKGLKRKLTIIAGPAGYGKTTLG